MTLRITLIMKEEKNNQNSSPHLFFSPPFEIAKKTSRFKTWMDCIIKISFKSDDSSEESNWPGMKVSFFFVSFVVAAAENGPQPPKPIIIINIIMRENSTFIQKTFDRRQCFFFVTVIHTHTYIHSFTFKLPILMQINLDSKSKKKEKKLTCAFCLFDGGGGGGGGCDGRGC